MKLTLNTLNNNNKVDDFSELRKKSMSIEELLIYATEHNCSDLYIKVFDSPYVSRYGKITRLLCTPITKDNWATFYNKYILNELNAGYVRNKLLDTSVSIRIPDTSPNYCKYPNNYYRYRVSFGFSEEQNIATFRMIKPDKPTFENINYNQKCVDALKYAYSQPSGICYETGPTGSGKALEKNTKIPTTSGFKLLKDINIGDIIFDKNGNQTKVVGKYHPNDNKFYEFTFNDGTKVKSAEGHLWEVNMCNIWKKSPNTQNMKFFNNNILYLLSANLDTHINMGLDSIYNLIYNLTYEEYCSKKELTDFLNSINIKFDTIYLDEFCKLLLDYYDSFCDTLDKTDSNINAILTTHDIVANGIVNNANRINFAIIKNKPCQYNSINSNKNYYSFGSWLGHEYLLNQSIDTNHLTNNYNLLSIQDKLDLLSGLLDSIGIIDTLGNCTINFNVKNILMNLREICCSLGFNCSKIKTNIINYRNIYSFSFYPTLELSLKVEDKKNKLLAHNNIDNKFYLTDIKEIEGKNEDYYCLSVDSNTHTFLCTESYLPTHNSTTLAACINTFTQPNDILDNKVIITLEDPIENMFESTDSVKINQKELGKDFLSFDLGIKAALREHPNMIIVGECRDKEVICAAIESARTGHICSTTFHAADVAGTMNRLLYHLDNDKNLSMDLILQLNIILSQKMIKQNDRYLVDTQFLLFNEYVTDKLVEVLETPDANISIEINKLIHNKELQEQGIVKDWDYSK